MANSFFNAVYMVNGRIVQFDDILVKQAMNPNESSQPISLEPELTLAAQSIRCKFQSGYNPTQGDEQTLVNADENIWDIKKTGTSWDNLLYGCTSLISVIEADTTGITRMEKMFFGCKQLRELPLFDTKSVTSMFSMCENCTSLTRIPAFDVSSLGNASFAFSGCVNVASGMLDFYNACKGRSMLHNATFQDCGTNTGTGSEEWNQLPNNWKYFSAE